MAARRGVPLPLLIVFACGIGALFFLTREPPLQRASGALATTPLEAPIRELQTIWSLAERILDQKQGTFTLRTLVVEAPWDRNLPPLSWYLAFRSITDDEDFSVRVNNAELEMVISATFPTPPQIGTLAPPEPIPMQAVTVTLGRALALADSVFAADHPGDLDPSVLADVVLRARGGTPEWSISYSRDGENGTERLARVTLDATDGSFVGGGSP